VAVCFSGRETNKGPASETLEDNNFNAHVTLGGYELYKKHKIIHKRSLGGPTHLRSTSVTMNTTSFDGGLNSTRNKKRSVL
jgi:hypothetical protein